jgi:hypothetical protein
MATEDELKPRPEDGGDPFTADEASILADAATDEGTPTTPAEVQTAYTGATLTQIQLAKLWAAYIESLE